MRRLLAMILAILTATTIVACSNAPAGSSDPYELARKSMDASWDKVQVDVTATSKGGSSDFTLEPGAIRFTSDGKSGKVAFHMAVPTSILGAEAASLRALGVTGDSVDIDVIFDGDALYAKSPVLFGVLKAFLAQSGQAPTGDMTGWLKLGTKADFESMGGSIVPGASAAATAAPDAATLKKELEANGVTLTFAGVEKKNGADANHLKAAIDVAKLSSDSVGGIGSAQLDQVKQLAKSGTVSADVWTDKGSNRVVEIDVHFVGNDKATVDITVGLKEPDAGASYDAPKDAVDLPIKDMLMPLLQMFGSGLTGG